MKDFLYTTVDQDSFLSETKGCLIHRDPSEDIVEFTRPLEYHYDMYGREIATARIYYGLPQILTAIIKGQHQNAD